MCFGFCRGFQIYEVSWYLPEGPWELLEGGFLGLTFPAVVGRRLLRAHKKLLRGGNEL